MDFYRNTCTCHHFDSFCSVHNRYTGSASASAQRPKPDLHDLMGLRAAPLEARETDLAPPAGMIAASMTIGRVIEVDEPVMLRPYNPEPEDFYAKSTCRCDIPAVFGHDTGCVKHPAPIFAEPLQLLLAAVQLISDQPTTEQWQTIKKAIQAFADLEPTARSE